MDDKSIYIHRAKRVKMRSRKMIIKIIAVSSYDQISSGSVAFVLNEHGQ